MPFISVVIPSYNHSKYLKECIRSIQVQSFRDIEIVVVDDKSTDDSVEVARSIASADDRVRVVELGENGGTFNARLTGIMQTTGDYVMLIDQDDELVGDAFEKMASELVADPVDLLHFGVRVVSDSIYSGSAVCGMESFMNPKPRRLYGADILAHSFTGLDKGGFDWNVHHRLYRGDLVRRVAKRLPRVRLTRPDDAVLSFAVALEARSYRALANASWYIYHLGRGVTLGSSMTVQQFDDICRQDAEAVSLVKEYAQQWASSSFNGSEVSAVLIQLKRRLLEHSANEWHDNVQPQDKEACFEILRTCWDDADIGIELYRFLRDAAYDVFCRAEQYRECSDVSALPKIKGLLAHLDKLDISEDAEANLSALQDGKRAFETDFHLAQDQLDQLKDWESQPIRIFVSTHRDTALFDSKILQPVQVGCALRSDRFPWALHDDEGENISELNAMYCELTTQYWAWKNVDAPYYGFCHYRRYFDFSDTRHQENSWGEVIDDRIDADAQERYGLTDASITRAIEGWDIVTTECKDLTLFPDDGDTPYEHYRIAPKLHINDLDRVIAILKEMHPDFAQDADAFLNGSHSCFCNMFVMRKELFSAYCSWLFPILERFMRDWDKARYSVEALRTPGHLAERLFNIYLIHLKRTNPDIKHKQVQCVHFEHPDRVMPLGIPPIASDPRPTIPVVFAADGKYAPMLTTTIYSMLANANKERCYDVIVLSRDIPGDTQETMRSFFASRFDNVLLRFHDVSATVDAFGLTTSNPHISVETYYRFLVPSELPFYDKVLYLDSDLIVEGDVAELYDTELGDNLLAATRDVDYLGNLNMPDGNRMKYTNDQLHMTNPYDYFQAGVLVLNTAAMRAGYSTQEWLQFAAEPGFIYDDQDVLNVHCEGRVTFLDASWNVMHDCCNRVADVFSFAPADVLRGYQDSRRHPKIRHYAGVDKPWNNVHCEWFDQYWAYARQTPFYERMLCHIDKGAEKVNLPPRAISETSSVRKVLDPLLPYGSRRRELLKKIGRKIRKR